MDDRPVDRDPADAAETPLPPEEAPQPAPEPDAEPPRAGAEAPGVAAGAPASEDVEAVRDRWLRAEAELQNYRRRAARDAEEARRAAEESVMLEVIGALDDLDRALELAPREGTESAWVEGVRLVSQRLREYLARQGVTLEDPVGGPFDPAFHEALLEMPAPDGAAPGTVLQVVLKGYRRGPRALRAARVVVARRPEAQG